jgi:hypothetical protein
MKSRLFLEGSFFPGGHHDLDYFLYEYRADQVASFTREVFEEVRNVRPLIRSVRNRQRRGGSQGACYSQSVDLVRAPSPEASFLPASCVTVLGPEFLPAPGP